MVQWLIDNYQIISLPVIAIFTWFFKGKVMNEKDLKDRDNNIESNQSEIVSKNLELYQRMLDDIEKRYEERILKSDKEIEDLEQIIIELKFTITELEDLNSELKLKALKFNNEIINLKNRIEQYEKES
jgi:thymidylate synthase